jgi:acetoin utilization protein AcuB
MRIERWMKHPVHTVKPLESVGHARALMERYRINQLPVVVDSRLVGIVTDRDLRDAFPSIFEPPHRGTTNARVDPSVIPVESVMTSNVLSVAPKDLVADAARTMRRERVGALPVVDGGRLVGILTRSDVLEALVSLVSDASVSSVAG